jgi:hypothetical protein
LLFKKVHGWSGVRYIYVDVNVNGSNCKDAET